MDASETSASDIAIVGMALRVPGASSVDAFWSNLVGGVESIRQLTPDELAAAERAGDPIHDPNYIPRTSDLPEMEDFDAEFFGLSPKEAAVMDPQHRHFLECTWQALEDAGRMPSRQRGPVGVWAASGMGSYFYFNVCSDRELVEQTGMFLLRHTGNDKDFLSTRVSFSLDLRGPSVNVQTACSSSLVAVHYAAQSLLNGECDMAVAGGVTIEQPHRRGYGFQEGEILSPDGHCRAFDHRAAGTVFGSGVGVVVLRRLSDALADGDIIHAVIKSSAINNDGASKAGYLAPSVTGQAEAIIEAQGLGGISPDSIGYVECHGTGTYLGDPIEIQALTEAFRLGTDRRNYCRVGSVKSNIGHLDTAAGVVSLIKAAMTVKTGQIPPTLGFEKPNPAIDFANSPFVVNDTLTAWPNASAPRRAGINSLGVGGTNAHVIIQQPPAIATPARVAGEAPTLLVLSAKSRKALDAAQVKLGEFIDGSADASLSDIAHTLLNGRESFEHRAVVAVRDAADAASALLKPDLKRVAVHTAQDGITDAVFLLPGGGAQHHGMVRELYHSDAQFRRTVDEGIGYLPAEAAAQLRAAWLEADQPSELLFRPSVQLPAILIIEVAIARMWMARGVTPKALVGHSMGENAAACIAGVFAFKDAVNLVRLRGELFETLPRGGMLSVPVAEAELRQLLPAELDMASVNAPTLCVVSGPDADLDLFAETLKGQGIDASRIPIDVAAHSRMLESILQPFGAFLSGLRLNPPTMRIISNVTGQTLTNAEATSPDYWVRHLRSTVRFEQCLAAVSGDAGLIYIEVGPSRALSSLAKAQGNIDANRVINSLPHPDEKVDDQLYVLTAVGRAWAAGLPMPAERLQSATGRRIQLPTYPFQHRRFFIERQQPVIDAEASLLRLDDMEAWGHRPAWRRSVPDIVAGSNAQKQTWLVFRDDGDTGQLLSERLVAAGHRVITVTSGDGFARRDAETYVVCPEHGRADYDALAAGLAADQIVADRIAYLPLLTHTSAFRPGSSFLNRIQESGFQGLLHLVQALSDAQDPQLHITVVTNGAQQVDGEGLRFPEKSTIEGPVLVVPREFAGITIRLVDVELETRAPSAGRDLSKFGRSKSAPTGTPPDVLEALWEELSADAGSEVAAWRAGRRWSRTHVPLALKKPENDDLFGNAGVYLLTGGLGDLALTFAHQLVVAKKSRVALFARTALPTRAHWPALMRVLPATDRRRTAIAAIQAMEQAGGEVLVLQGDVTNPLDVRNALDQVRAKWGQLTGVLHTAGVVDDAPLQAKTAESADLVLAPKVLGTMVLADALADEKISTMVLFSSTSSDTAPAGQVDYVAANAFLNAFAESQSARTDRWTVAVHWGIWNQVGMAARSVADATGGHEVLAPANGPFFQRWIEDDEGVRWLEAQVQSSTNWMFNEHRLKSGEALMPGTGYVELISQAMREAELPPLAIEALEFRSPMFAPDGETVSVRLRIGFADGGYDVTVASVAGDILTVNAVARLVPAPEVPASIDVAGIEQRCALRAVEAGPGEALTSAQEDHLRFGARWKVLRSQRSGTAEAFARLSLSASFKPDLEAGYLTHPALLDIATGFAMDIVPGYAGSNALWAPASYGQIVQLRPLPAEIVSWVRLADSTAYGDGFAGFDIVLATPDGTVVLVVNDLLLRRLDATQGFARAASPKRVHAPTSNALQQLARQVRQGILPHEALEALERALGTGVAQPIVSSMDLAGLIRRAERMAGGPKKSEQLFDRSADLDSAFVAPGSPTEIRLAEFWRELLGIDQIGVDDNFFDIGGHSLVAVRLFRSVRKEFGVDLPISTLFEAPTIALLAKLLPAAANDEMDVQAATTAAPVELIHRVSMHIPADKSATPLFICAGMFGNVLNLRQLARQVGMQRPVYGLQARGIYGDTPPHETFEEAAASCIVEMRAVQPHGPYLLAGFSGGGLVAYEMAQQLMAAGEVVSQVIMLDTPLPTQPDLSRLDRASMKLQDLRRDGFGFFARYLADRAAWELEKRQKQEGLALAGATDRLNNEAVESAFRRALERYTVRPYAGDVALFRPQPEIEYHLSNGRKLMPGRNFFFEDNGWTSFVARLKVVVVPGDHDSMVLDPNVRVLSDHIRRLLASADASGYARKAAE